MVTFFEFERPNAFPRQLKICGSSGAAVEPGSELPDSMALRRVQSTQRNAASGVLAVQKTLAFSCRALSAPGVFFRCLERFASDEGHFVGLISF